VSLQGEELEALEVKEHHHHYNRHHSRAKLPSHLFHVAIAMQNLQKPLSLQASKMSFLLTNRLPQVKWHDRFAPTN
jgi:hypothetical protein